MAGALLISLPLASIATLIWLHIDGQETEQLALFSKEVLWLVIPSMVFFLSLPTDPVADPTAKVSLF